MTRIGKIARLPQAVRDELNRRLADGEPGSTLLPWLDSLAPVRAVLDRQFGGAAITKQNLSEWRKGGFQEWQARQELLADARRFSVGAKELRDASEGRLTDDLATVLAAQYAVVLRGWQGRVDATLEARLKVLHKLCQDISVLRDGDHNVAQLKFEWERLGFAKEKQMAAIGERDRSRPGQRPAVVPREMKKDTPTCDPKRGQEVRAGDREEPAPGSTPCAAEPAKPEVQPSPTWSNENFFSGAGVRGVGADRSDIFPIASQASGRRAAVPDCNLPARGPWEVEPGVCHRGRAVEPAQVCPWQRLGRSDRIWRNVLVARAGCGFVPLRESQPASSGA